jgi:hypothetical protein
MDQKDVEKLRSLTSFDDLVAYLRDELDWPIGVDDAEDMDAFTFDYDPDELGIDTKYAVSIDTIKQIRPLADNQPWGIFYIQFESKRLPVVVLRRILRSLVRKAHGGDPDQPVWRMFDLLFISAQGEPGYRSISFAQFRRREDRADELRTFSWDTRETHFYYIRNLNLEALRWPDDETDRDSWRAQWSQAFTVEHRYTITKSQELAREMAHHAATVRDLVNDVYGLETDDGPLHQLHESFREALLHDLTLKAFADMVAQTVAYGLFSAATQTEDLSFDQVVELIPNTNPFLKELLAELTTEGAVDLEELGVGQLVALLCQTDVEAILHDFGRQTGGGREDPVVHFYEDFLREYDRAQKVQRGVFYTPDPVVSYIVRSVDYLLKEEFGLEDGLADTTMDLETGEPLVQILDPAAGTGTFLAHVVDQIEATVKAKPGADWNEYVAKHLLPRLHGFELMMAPYAVAHMKLGLKLRQTGYDFGGGERLRVYLTNTLEEPVEVHETLALAGFLSKESNQAARVKRQTPIMVVIGNPPYANFGRMNTGEWIKDLIGEWKPPGEKKWNPDDFMKFMRWAQWRIEQTGQGVLAFITNSTFIDGITHRCMRQSLMETFTVIYVFDLHGSSMRSVAAPAISLDENVFDIRPGVSIGIFVKIPDKKEHTQVRHAELWGNRESKYGYLLDEDVTTTHWTELTPTAKRFFFVPRDLGLEDEYSRYPSLKNAFVVGQNGIKTDRDSLFFDFEQKALEDRMRTFYSDAGMLPDFSQRYRAQDTSSYSLLARRRRTSFELANIRQCLYRPFDIRWLYYTPGLTSRPAWDVMRHVLARENLVLFSCRQQAELGFHHIYCSAIITDHSVLSVKTREITTALPLYLYPDLERPKLIESEWPSGPGGRYPNLNQSFVRDLEERLGLAFIPDGCGNLSQTFGPEDFFHSIYAILHSPTYRTRYAEFLKIDFPRLPLTSDVSLFRVLVGPGADLVALHLLKDDYPAASWNQQGKDSPLQHPITTFVERETGKTMGNFSKRTCYKGGRVYLDTSQRSRSSYFEGVPKDVWGFHIGGYRVLHKWLYDRRGTRGEPGRTLTEEDIAHYQRIVVALKETMRLMEEIDKVIEAHGGWPIE